MSEHANDNVTFSNCNIAMSERAYEQHCCNIQNNFNNVMLKPIYWIYDFVNFIRYNCKVIGKPKIVVEVEGPNVIIRICIWCLSIQLNFQDSQASGFNFCGTVSDNCCM